jgi:hypothetical protein
MDNLWAGLPIVTILGDQLHSRVSADFCTILGVPEVNIFCFFLPGINVSLVDSKFFRRL